MIDNLYLKGKLDYQIRLLIFDALGHSHNSIMIGFWRADKHNYYILNILNWNRSISTIIIINIKEYIISMGLQEKEGRIHNKIKINKKRFK